MASNSSLPLVSVIITTYNREDVLAEAIDSALNQTYPHVEVIVVDDESTDGTPRLLASYGDSIVAVRRQNGGYGAARNTGFQHARGEYVAWLDSDDIFLPEKIAVQVAYMERHPDVVLISSDFSGFDENGLRSDTVRSYYSAFSDISGGAETIYPDCELWDTNDIAYVGSARRRMIRARSGHVLDHLVQGSFIHPPTVMQRRSAMSVAGALDETLRNSVEFEYLFRLAPLGRMAFMDDPLIRYRFSAGQISGPAHKAGLYLSTLRVMLDLPSRHPEVVGRAQAAYRCRLAVSHLDVAYILAEVDRSEAWKHWCAAHRFGVVTQQSLLVLGKLAIPSSSLPRLRRVRSMLNVARRTALSFVSVPSLSFACADSVEFVSAISAGLA